MFKRLFKGIFTALGMVVGYELFSLFNYYVSEEAKTNPEYMELSKMEAFWMGILFEIGRAHV